MNTFLVFFFPPSRQVYKPCSCSAFHTVFALSHANFSRFGPWKVAINSNKNRTAPETKIRSNIRSALYVWIASIWLRALVSFRANIPVQVLRNVYLWFVGALKGVYHEIFRENLYGGHIEKFLSSLGAFFSLLVAVEWIHSGGSQRFIVEPPNNSISSLKSFFSRKNENIANVNKSTYNIQQL